MRISGINVYAVSQSENSSVSLCAKIAAVGVIGLSTISLVGGIAVRDLARWKNVPAIQAHKVAAPVSGRSQSKVVPSHWCGIRGEGFSRPVAHLLQSGE
jgi:hypothetical protein